MSYHWNFSMGRMGPVTQSTRRHSINRRHATWCTNGYSMGLGKRFRDSSANHHDNNDDNFGAA
jgi:hypothetical protein